VEPSLKAVEFCLSTCTGEKRIRTNQGETIQVKNVLIAGGVKILHSCRHLGDKYFSPNFEFELSINEKLWRNSSDHK
jgi:hypothetical protein